MHPRSSRRRLVSQPQQEPGEGLRREGADGEDLISALPDDLLPRLGCVREAARTSALSRRWRGLWVHLGDLTFHGVDPALLEGALGQVRPKPFSFRIRYTYNRTISAARVVGNIPLGDGDLDAAFELPCFERAASIGLTIRNHNFTLPQVGEFASLKELYLRGDISDLGNLLLRCLCLRSLYLFGRLRADTISIHSKTLCTLSLKLDPSVPQSTSWEIDIAVPNLKSFAFLPLASEYYEFNLSITEPRIEDLHFFCIGYIPKGLVSCGLSIH